MVTAVKELDDELTDQKVELTLHGAAIKQLLEDRVRGREHNWQIKLLVATIVLTDAVQLIATLYHR